MIQMLYFCSEKKKSKTDQTSCCPRISSCISMQIVPTTDQYLPNNPYPTKFSTQIVLGIWSKVWPWCALRPLICQINHPPVRDRLLLHNCTLCGLRVCFSVCMQYSRMCVCKYGIKGVHMNEYWFRLGTRLCSVCTNGWCIKCGYMCVGSSNTQNYDQAVNHDSGMVRPGA